MNRAKSKIALFVFLGFSFLTNAQEQKPLWMDTDIRNMQFSSDRFYSGYAVVIPSKNETFEEVENRAKQKALSELSERVRLTVKSSKLSETVSVDGTNIEEQILSTYNAVVQTESQTEIVGSKLECYHDKKNNEIHAFVYVNKNELASYYAAQISLNMKQLEAILQTASQFETANEKVKARKNYQEAIPMLVKVEYAQEMLITINPNVSFETLQKEKSETFRRNIVQALARLAQGVYFYVESIEDLFGKSENIVANKVKADLAHNGCSFVDNTEMADFQLIINVNVRFSSQNDYGVFCYADVEVELFDIHKQKTVFGDKFSEKGGSSSQEKAGRNAMETAANKITEKLKKWIE